MIAPFQLSLREEVVTWIEEKNKETSSNNAKISYTINPALGFLSRFFNHYLPLETKEGTIWISSNAMKYLSVPETQSKMRPVDQLSLHILAEHRLQKEVVPSPLPDEELIALNRFLSLFKLVLQQEKIEGTQKKIVLKYIHQSHRKENGIPSSSTPEFITKIFTRSEEKNVQQNSEVRSHEKETIHFSPLIDQFLLSPHSNKVPQLVQELLTKPRPEDQLFLKKFLHKLHTVKTIPSNEKIKVLHRLLVEYEKQALLCETRPGYSFEEFSKTLIEEIFGPHNETTKGYDYLNGILSLQQVAQKTSTPIESLLTPHMNETLELYLLLHPKKTIHEHGPLASYVKQIDAEYKTPHRPTLWERMHQAHS